MKRCIIVNPKAGSVKDLDGLLEKFGRLDPAAIHLTAECGQAEARARAAAENGIDEIIIAGGDGTLNDIVNGIAPRFDVRVGLIPLGTGNDFSRCLTAPESVDENIDVILGGRTRAVDVVRAGSEQTRYFLNVSAGGFSGLVNEKLTPEMKKTWGPLAYLRSAAAALPDLRSYRTTVELDAGENVDVDLYNVVIANGRYVAGGLPIAPEADPCDGLLDVVLIASRPASEMAVLAAQIYVGKHLESNAVTFRRSKRVSVRSDPGMWFNVDGELVGNEPIVFEVMPKALQFLAKE